MTIRKNDCRSNTPVRKGMGIAGGGGDGEADLPRAPLLTRSSPGEPGVLRWKVPFCQHLQSQHQHLCPLLQVLP